MAMPGCLRHITRSLWVLRVSFLSGRTLGRRCEGLTGDGETFFIAVDEKRRR